MMQFKLEMGCDFFSFERGHGLDSYLEHHMLLTLEQVFPFHTHVDNEILR